MLRWAPVNSESWRLGNQYGYRVRKTVVLKDKKVPREITSEIITNTPIKPAPIAEWEKHAEEKYPAIAAECIFSEYQETTSGNNPFSVYKKYKNEQHKFSFALYAADQSLVAAKLSGLYIADRAVKGNEKYFYEVYLNLPDSLLQDTASALAGISEYQPLPKPYDFRAEWDDKSVSLSWDMLYQKHIYNSYVVEKSADGGKTYTDISDNATVQLSDKGVVPRRMYKTDSLPENGKIYYYRVRGKSAFGETGPPSDSVFGYGIKPLKEAPVIVSNDVIDNKKVRLVWDYPEEMNKYISGFRIYRSNNPEAKKTVIYNGNIPEAREYTDDEPSITNYYNIAVVSGTQEKLSQILTFTQLIDSFPPKPPTGILATIDTTGIVLLNWNRNTDDDIDGYRVYSANKPENEFILVTPSVLTDTFFSREINIKTLTEKIYFKVKAVDLRGNQSQFSELITVTRPDIIPPVAPVILSAKLNDKEIEINWINSSSTDVVSHSIYRKEKNDSLYQSIGAIEKKENNSKSVFKDKNPENNKVYLYYVVATDDNGLVSQPSKIMSCTTPITKVESIKLKKKTYTDKVTLSWEIKSSKEVQRVLVYRSKEDEPMRLYGNTEIGSYTDEKLSLGKNYHYAIKVVYTDGSMSDMSNKVKVKM
jgi:fibronectin type 3 domain-containing protein